MANSEQMQKSFSKILFGTQTFRDACSEIVLEEDRTIQNYKNCKSTALNMINYYEKFIKNIEMDAGYLSYPLGGADG